MSQCTNYKLAGSFNYCNNEIPLWVSADAVTYVGQDELIKAIRAGGHDGQLSYKSLPIIVDGQSYQAVDFINTMDLFANVISHAGCKEVMQQIRSAISEGYVTRILTNITGMANELFVSRHGEIYVACSKEMKTYFSGDVSLPLLSEGIIQGRVNVLKESIYYAGGSASTSLHHAAVLNAVAQWRVNNFIHMNTVTSSGYIIIHGHRLAVHKNADHTYISATDAAEFAGTIAPAEDININCMFVKTPDGHSAVVFYEDLAKWCASVSNNFIDQTIEKPVEPVPDNQHHNAVQSLVTRWFSKNPANGMSPQEYQRAFLRDCSDAYIVASNIKSPFDIMYC